METKQKRHSYFSAARTLPVIIAAFSLLHVILFTLGADMRGMDGLYGTSFTTCVFMLLMSKALGLCAIHRMCIVYSLLVTACIKVNRWLTFGPFVDEVATLLIATGACLLSAAMTKFIYKKIAA